MGNDEHRASKLLSHAFDWSKHGADVLVLIGVDLLTHKRIEWINDQQAELFFNDNLAKAGEVTWQIQVALVTINFDFSDYPDSAHVGIRRTQPRHDGLRRSIFRCGDSAVPE